MTSKYHAEKVIIDNIKFDSKLESRRYSELKLLQKAGEIQTFEVHPEFKVLDSFNYQDKKIQGISYTGDFLIVYPDGKRVVEDAKGMITDASKIRIKLFKRRYPDIRFKIVKKEEVRR